MSEVFDCDFDHTSFVAKALTGLPGAGYWVQTDVYIPAATFAALTGTGQTADLVDVISNADSTLDGIGLSLVSGTWKCITEQDWPPTPNGAFTADAWHTIEFQWTGFSGGEFVWYLDGVEIFRYSDTGSDFTQLELQVGMLFAPSGILQEYVYTNVRVGSSRHGTDLFCDDFSSGTFAQWDDNPGCCITTFSPDAPTGPCAAPVPPAPTARRGCVNVPARFLVTDLNSVPTTWLDNLSLGATLTYNLLQPATIDVPVHSNDPRVNTIFAADGDPLLAQSNRLIYAFFREGGSPVWKCRGAGIAMSPQDQADADVPTTHMVFYDAWQYLIGRPCFADTSGTVIGADGFLFPATEMGVIAATLLKNSIESEGVGCFIDAGTSYGGTGFWAGTIETTPVVDYTVQQGSSVGDAWNQIVALQDPSGGTMLGGCDIILTPIYDPVNRPGYTHELSIYNLAGDDLHTSPIAWAEFVRSATTADRQHDGTPGQFVNVTDFHVGQGGYPVPIGGPPPSNGASVALYRPYWESRFFPQQVSAEAVLALAHQELQLRKQGKRTFTVDLDPARSGMPLRDYNVGDRIPLNVPAALRVKATGMQRIQTIPISVGPDGMTRVSGLLTSPDWRGF